MDHHPILLSLIRCTTKIQVKTTKLILKFLLQVKEMMDNIRQAFREEVSNLTWIDDTTRPKVYEKVIVGHW